MGIYDAEKHIDINSIKKILKDHEGKKIICFGGGSAARVLMERILIEYDVDCFLDNNKKLWGDSIWGKEICSPAVLEKYPKGSFIVLILSKYITSIKEQLEKMGLVEGSDYFDVYSKFLEYFRIKKFESNVFRLEKFLKRIPKHVFDNIPIQTTPRIGIVCIASMLQNNICYSLAQAILLRYRGYSPVIIVDGMKGFDSEVYFQGIEDVAVVYLNYLFEIIKNVCRDIEVIYINGEQGAELDDVDVAICEGVAPYILKWFTGQRDDLFLENNSKRLEIATGILQNNLAAIKYFFSQHRFDVINVHTGLHRHNYMYTHIAQKEGIRVSTYDGESNGVTNYSTNGPASHGYDIEKMFTKNLSKEKLSAIVDLAKDDFKKRKNSTIADEGYNYQRTLPTNDTRSYDVLIPLNISWDAAALYVDDVFSSEIEWLDLTLKYLIEKTNATVMIREHPAQVLWPDEVFEDKIKELPILQEYPERLCFVKAEDKINTYQFIERCKLVLPYTSTVGIEAAMLGKNVLLHTKAYYRELGFAFKASSKEEYFKMIKRCLESDGTVDVCENQNNAFLAYYYSRIFPINTVFTEELTEWMDLSLSELNNLDGVDAIMKIIANNKSSIETKLGL